MEAFIMDLLHENAAKWVSISLSSEEENLIKEAAALAEPVSLELCSTDSGEPNLKHQNSEDKSVLYLHSQQDPRLEAKEWFASLDLNHVQAIYVYGIGLGYYYEAAKAWLKENPGHYLIFIEDDPEVIRYFLETERCQEMLGNPQVHICLLGPRSGQVGQFTRLTLLFSGLKHVYSGLKAYEKNKYPLFTEYKSTVAFLTTMSGMLHSESLTHGFAFFRNFYQNLLDLPKSYLGNHFKGQFASIPAIICGAGPSLNKNIDVLATLTDKAIIFAGGTALNALNGKGVMPHFGVGIDPNPDQFTRLVMNHAFETPFLYRGRMLHEALNMVHGERVYLTGSGGYEVGDWFGKKLDVEDINLQEGFNVLNFSVMIAHMMGCNPIICVGVDLAYSEGESYAAGVVSHPVHSRKKNFRTKHQEDELISKNDINGKPVFTLWKWIAESMWYTNFADSHPDTKLINATEGGIGFPNVMNMTLAEVKEKYLDKQWDLKTKLHGEIQNSPVPKSFNEENIEKLIRSLNDSLSRCGEICQNLATQLAKEIKHPHEDITEKIDTEVAKLQHEHAYGAILKRFNDDYLSRNARDLKRLEREKSNFSSEEYNRRKAVLEQGRFLSLKDTCLFNAGFVYDLLEKHKKSQQRIKKMSRESISSLKQKYPLPTSKTDESYYIDKELFRIYDRELNLYYSESFDKKSNPEESVVQEILKYPSGKLKMVLSYRSNTLHGPSIFYAEDGKILARAWFVDGLQEGKMRTWYTNGSLHSLQQYSQGQAIGTHRYFYHDGLPKSVLPYKDGALHGEVVLFSPEGILVRQLTFDEGKRSGLEQIWNEEGQLLIESEFAGDRPVRVTRMWHPNGTLAKEIVYNKDSQVVEVKEWDPKGVLLVEDTSKNEDYFDLVNKETDNLTASLTGMVAKMAEIAPLFAERFHVDVPPLVGQAVHPNLQNEMAEELTRLKKEMEYLQAINTKIKEQLTGDEAKEAIWKTPSSRREMEKQFEAMRDKINTGLGDIQKGIKTVVDNLKKENPEK